MYEIQYWWIIGNDRYNEMLEAVEKACTKYNVAYEIIEDKPIRDGHFYGGLYDSETGSYVRRVVIQFTDDRESQVRKVLLEV